MLLDVFHVAELFRSQMIILKHIKYSQVVKALKFEKDYGKNQLFSLNFA
jgi:hypothetical protein